MQSSDEVQITSGINFNGPPGNMGPPPGLSEAGHGTPFSPKTILSQYPRASFLRPTASDVFYLNWTTIKCTFESPRFLAPRSLSVVRISISSSPSPARLFPLNLFGPLFTYQDALSLDICRFSFLVCRGCQTDLSEFKLRHSTRRPFYSHAWRLRNRLYSCPCKWAVYRT